MNKLLLERQKTHGDYAAVARKYEALRREFLPNDFTDGQSMAIDMICVKLARIACGDANFQDHWDDIAGYAKLANMEQANEPE